MEGYGSVVIVCTVAIVVGILLGNSAVYFFNRIPGKWLCDYGQEPDEELAHPTVQRVRSTPWKYIFSGFFIICGIKMGMEDPLYAIAAVAALWLLLEMSIADIKYRIVPDQFIMLLVITGIGFLPHHVRGVMDCFWGALLGFGVLFSMAIIGKLIYKKPAIGGADVKLFAALGLATGTDGICSIFILTTFLSAGHFIWLLIRKQAKLSDQRPMVPYVAIATTFYVVFFHEIMYNITI